jgi:hypothetical protein
MKCPNCTRECWRDSADVGIGVMYGPWGCPCGWSESDEYDQLNETNRALTPTGYRKDQWGGLTPTSPAPW